MKACVDPFVLHAEEGAFETCGEDQKEEVRL